MLVQLSDPHLGAGWPVRDPGEALARAVVAVAALRPAPEAVLISGDLTDDGRDESYATVAAAASRLGVPVHVLPGNHDDRAAMRRHFDLPGAGREPVCYSTEVGELRLVVLDGTRPGSEAGQLDAERLAWLERELAAAPEHPTLLATHHPPLRLGVRAWDEIGLPDPDREALGEVLGRHPQVLRILCGHLHRALSGELAGRPVFVAPSAYAQVRLGLTPDAGIEIGDEPPGFAIHVFERGALLSHVQPLPAGPA